MKSIHIRLLGSVLLLIAAVALVFVKTERIVILLPPVSGAENRVQLSPETQYAQEFLVNQTSLARLGFFFVTRGSLSSEPVTLTLERGGKEIAKSTLQSVFIDSQGPSYWEFKPPLKTIKGERLTAKVTIPTKLGSQISVRTRIPDGTFRAQDASFLIDTKVQPAPLAYEVYAGYKPPLSTQIALLCVIAAGALIIKPKNHVFGIVGSIVGVLIATIAYISPTLFWNGYIPWYLVCIQTVAFVGMYWFLKSRGLHTAAAMVGAAIFTYTTWWPLQFAATRYVYGIVAALPLLYIILSPSQASSKRQAAGLLVLAGVITIFWQGLVVPPLVSTNEVASLRDILLDPYQVPYAQKVISDGQDIPWHNFGAYVGIPAAMLILIGIATSAHKHPKLLITAIALITLLSIAPILPGTITTLITHTSIFLVMIFAYQAALGLENLRHYLGYHSRIPVFLTSAVALIIVLDLWHVAADVVENLGAL